MINQGYVVNLHITEVCNYKCVFCHCRFKKSNLKVEDWFTIVDNITNSIKVSRFNIAGGEPLIYKELQKLIDYIYSKGIKVSIISNGSLITDDFLSINKEKIDMIGISIDCLNDRKIKEIGRISGNKFLSRIDYENLCSKIKANKIKLKINTVITNINYDEDFREFIRKVDPNRWKVFKATHFKNQNDFMIPYLAKDNEFSHFIERHSKSNIVIEDNQDLINSYIMINPQGKLVDNSGYRYNYSQSLVYEDFRKVFRELNFNYGNYSKRYK